MTNHIAGAMAKQLRLVPTLLVTALLIAGVAAENVMFSGQSLNTGQFLENDIYKFIMQTDCNLVLYKNQNQALWASGTYGQSTNCRATLQNNGNLVLFSSANGILWTSNSARGPNIYRLIVQIDGNVVIYGAALWATNTVQGKKRLL